MMRFREQPNLERAIGGAAVRLRALLTRAPKPLLLARTGSTCCLIGHVDRRLVASMSRLGTCFLVSGPRRRHK